MRLQRQVSHLKKLSNCRTHPHAENAVHLNEPLVKTINRQSGIQSVNLNFRLPILLKGVDVAQIVDAGDLILMPGLVDSHVHVNEPGK